MFRISGCIVKTSTLLMRRSNPVELRIASLKSSPTNALPLDSKPVKVRGTVPPPKPPPPPPVGNYNFFMYFGILACLTAGFVWAAGPNKEIRDWLTIHYPWFDDIIAAVYQENVSIRDSIDEYVESFKKYLDELMKEKPKECDWKYISLPPPNPHTPFLDMEEDEECEEEEEEEDEDKEPVCEAVTPPIVTKDICELEKCLKEMAEVTINNYLTAIEYCKYYNELVDEKMHLFTYKDLKFLASQKAEREEIIKHHVKDVAKEYLKKYRALANWIDCGADGPQDRLDVSRQMAKDFDARIKRAQIELKLLNQEALIRDQQWCLVAKVVDVYASETSSLYPELDWMSEPVKINGNYDLQIIHTKKYVENLEDAYETSLANYKNKVDRAYKSLCVKEGKEREAEDKLKAAIKKGQADLAKEYADKMTKFRKRNDEQLKKTLKKNHERAQEKLKRDLEAKTQQCLGEAEKRVEKEIAEKKKGFDKQLAVMKQALDKVEEKLAMRLKAESETKRAQEMYRAASALLYATQQGAPRVKVDKELDILRKAAVDDELVSTVLNAIPKDVDRKGVVPECEIKKKYYNMEDLAKKVAMVEAEGGPLPVYALSYIQSKFLFMTLDELPQKELDRAMLPWYDEGRFKDLDTFDLLQRARYFMARGKLALAVQYVDAMSGASRGAAEAWYRDANGHLQTRQAAEVILAHAAALSLKYLI